MASLQAEEKIEFLLHMLATCEEFKPNYGALAKRLGINTNGNAQRRLKGIVESEKKFTLKSGKNAATRVVENGNGNGTDHTTSSSATNASKSKKRTKPMDNGNHEITSLKRRKKAKTEEQEGLSLDDLTDDVERQSHAPPRSEKTKNKYKNGLSIFQPDYMDLFHAITQEIENVLSCHWLDEFRQSKNLTSRSSSSSKSNTPSASRNQSPARISAYSRSASSSSSSNSGSSNLSASPVLSGASSISDFAVGKMSGNNTKMMDTERGGEQTQYESIQTVTEPTRKQSGQLGENVPGTTTATNTSEVDPERAEKTADNIRYGQNMSESGMGGMTTTSTGTANQEGGYGGTEAQESLESSSNTRASQGYTPGDGKHDYKVGG